MKKKMNRLDTISELNESKKLKKVIKSSDLLNEGYSEDKKTQADIAKVA